METTIVYWGFIGIMEKKMETTGAERAVAIQRKISRRASSSITWQRPRVQQRTKV